MKRGTILMATAAFALWAPATRAASEKFMVDGIEVILKANPGTPVVSVNLALRGGLPYYGVDQAGIELAMANAARKGSANFPKEKLQGILSRTGAQLSADARGRLHAACPCRV